MAKQRREDAHDHAVLQAWFGEAFARQKKLGSPDRFMSRSQASKRQTVEQQRSVLQVISQQYGLRMRPHKKEARA